MPDKAEQGVEDSMSGLGGYELDAPQGTGEWSVEIVGTVNELRGVGRTRVSAVARDKCYPVCRTTCHAGYLEGVRVVHAFKCEKRESAEHSSSPRGPASSSSS